MSQRDERLFPLFRSVEALPKIGKKSAEALGSKGISRVMDLLMVLPRDGIVRTPVDTVMRQDFPAVVTVPVTVVSHQPGWRKDAPHKVLVDDAKTRFQLVFFRTNADWLQKQLPVGAQRIVSGQAELYDNQVQITHPDYILDTKDSLPRFEPIYPALSGLAPKNIRLAIDAATQAVPDLEEWIPNAVLSSKKWASWAQSLKNVHHPKDAHDLNLNAPARVRLAFDELLAHQIALHLGRKDREKPEGVTRQINMPDVDQAKAALPFDLTNGQAEAVTEILSDISSTVRMNRMLQGDVGAGKTAVGFLAMAAVASAGEQSVMMAPTEVLARQHSNELATWCRESGLTLACLTGRNTAKERRDILAKLAEGEVDILVGTHAVFEDKVVFKKLGLAVIDEQHRFGVAQRKRLADKGHAVDVLIMTATPIPRSLALTHFGDMDVSLLTEKPAGRRPIDTVLVSMDRTDEIVSRLRAAIAKEQQAYWVCPLVSDSPILDKTAAESRFIKLKKELGSEVVALVHGQMSGEEKEAALTRFANGEAKVLVATTVIEVGVNVPNATIMVVEGAEGFGLSQLHQLRGRVGRSDKASTCVLLYDPPLSENAEARLRALRETNDGFKLAELDLEQRGAGDVLGVAQSGLPRFQIANLDVHRNLLSLANDTARIILNGNPSLDGPEGKAIRALLQIMDKERAFQFLDVG